MNAGISSMDDKAYTAQRTRAPSRTVHARVTRCEIKRMRVARDRVRSVLQLSCHVTLPVYLFALSRKAFPKRCLECLEAVLKW